MHEINPNARAPPEILDPEHNPEAANIRPSFRARAMRFYLEDGYILQEFVDPRHSPEFFYNTMNVFHKARVMSEYRTKVLRFLRGFSMDEAGRDVMRGLGL